STKGGGSGHRSCGLLQGRDVVGQRACERGYSGHFRAARPEPIVAPVSERHAVRAGAVAVTAAALALPALMAVPQRLPATAMGSGLLLYLQRALAVLGSLRLP